MTRARAQSGHVGFLFRRAAGSLARAFDCEEAVQGGDGPPQGLGCTVRLNEESDLRHFWGVDGTCARASRWNGVLRSLRPHAIMCLNVLSTGGQSK
jgi:hypothetical protein